MNTRLKTALDLLRFDEDSPTYHQTNLLSAIHSHAILRGDTELESACESEIARIQENNVNQLARQAKAEPVTVTQVQGPRASEPYISVITWTNHDKRTVIDGGQTRDEATRLAATFRTPEFRTVKIFCRYLNWGVEWKRTEKNTWTEVGAAIEPGPR